MTDPQRESFVLDVLSSGLIRFGDVVATAHGHPCTYYADLRAMCSYPRLVEQAVAWLRSVTLGVAHDSLCGIETASLPLVGAYGLRYMQPTLYLRTKRKDYGARRIIEGHYAAGARVILVDDLIAEPEVTQEFLELAREAGVQVVGLYVLFEKLHPRRSRDVLARSGVPIGSLFTYTDVAAVIRRHHARLGCDPARAALVRAFGDGDSDGRGHGGD